jgi:hypothetical protein
MIVISQVWILVITYCHWISGKDIPVIFQQLLDHFLGPRGSEAGELVVPRDYVHPNLLDFPTKDVNAFNELEEVNKLVYQN